MDSEDEIRVGQGGGGGGIDEGRVGGEGGGEEGEDVGDEGEGEDSGGRGTGGRRLWKVLVSRQKPVLGSTGGGTERVAMNC